MLAALLLNLDLPGGVPKAYDEEKANRYLKTLREEHFERQERDKLLQDLEAVKALEPKPKIIYRLPKIGDEIPGATAAEGSSSRDDELALLLILAEMD